MILTILSVIGGLIISLFLYSNYTVQKANRKFYNALLDKGYSELESKGYMLDENIAYQSFVSISGGGGLQLRHWLDKAIDNY